MPIGAQEELGLRMISLSVLMALSSCPSFPGECSDPKKESWQFINKFCRTVEEIEGWMAGDDSFMAHWK